MDKEIIKKLLSISNSIASLYEKFIYDENLDETLMNLKIALEQEKRIYELIPVSTYKEYEEYIKSVSFFDSKKILACMFETSFLDSRVRILNYFCYLKENYAMHSDKIEEEESLLRKKYLMNKDFFRYLKLFYTFYFSGSEDLFALLYPSFLNVSYSFLYAEEYFLNPESTFPIYNKNVLEKFSGISNISSIMDTSFVEEIKKFYNFLFDTKEEQLFHEEQISYAILCIYISSLYFSLHSEEKIDSLLKEYTSNHYSHFSSKMQKFLDSIILFINENKECIRNLKKVQEGLPNK